MSTINKPTQSPTPTVNNPGVKESEKMFASAGEIKMASNDCMPMPMDGASMPSSLKPNKSE